MVELQEEQGINQGRGCKADRGSLYLGTLIIKSGDADGEVAGAMNATGDVLRPAFQYVKHCPESVCIGCLSDDFARYKIRRERTDGICRLCGSSESDS